ncbi:hypothetical protein LXM50_09530 [Microbacterium sp. Au-Mic1]|uniref:hypothetical protein n=1 Tax=Microbacterium sp. Au-Mic1 TaxID=2906457 RepID=UPI001E512860|nr:hypothetical protein [Microbacterium sp. Au-Mic1]MCE4026215.1 hypothetical protein [Microbacterium sp. Au-Mic1]
MPARTWKQDLDDLLAVLRRTQAVRDERREFVKTPDGTAQLGWVLYEREQMFAAVNGLRAKAGKDPVALEKLTSAETRAAGHIDYTSKFAMGCADLVAR